MGGVPMLLIVAALGVDYGWQPDGGGGVEYVIQVQPDQWDNVKRLGEITSTIDPEVQGRVSRVIIRVGNQQLPRRTPPPLNNTQTSSYNQFQPNGPNSARPNSSNTIAAVDLVPVPIPEMTNRRDAIPIPAGAGDFGAPTSASMMKPDPASPQGSGFSLPDALKNVANGLNETSRETIEKLQQNVGVSAPNPLAANQLDSALNQLRQQGAATNNAIDQISQAGRSAFAMQGPSTDPVNSATSRVQPPSFTNSADPAAAYARARENGPSTDPTNQSTAWTPIADTRNDAVAPQGTTGGFGATGTFAQQPDSLRTPPNPSYAGAGNTSTENPFATAAAARSIANPGEAEVDPRLSAKQRAALPPGAYSFDLDGFPVDRDWRRIDTSSSNYASNAQSTNGLGPANSAAQTYQNQTTFPGNASQNWTGSAASAMGQPSSVGSLSGSPAFGPVASTNSQLTYQNQPPYAAPAYSTTQVTESDIDRIVRERLADAARLAANNNSFSGVPSPSSTVGRGVANQDGSPSSSDLTHGASTGTSTGGSQTGSGAKSTVAAQKLFNVMLLCSIVGNIYLFFWLKNMRDQFRDLVTAKRMSQSSVAA